jgi:hypothetical protein
MQIDQRWRLSEICADAVCDVIHHQLAYAVNKADLVFDKVMQLVEVHGTSQTSRGCLQTIFS